MFLSGEAAVLRQEKQFLAKGDTGTEYLNLGWSWERNPEWMTAILCWQFECLSSELHNYNSQELKAWENCPHYTCLC